MALKTSREQQITDAEKKDKRAQIARQNSSEEVSKAKSINRS